MDDDEANEWQDDSDDDDDVIPCPHCKEDIYDGAEQCPHCGQYVSEEDSPREGKPLWITLAAIVCLAMAVLWLFV